MSGSGAARIPPQHYPACFGCGDSPAGLHLPRPHTEGAERYEAYIAFDERHQGGPGLVHGGIVSAALDEACGLLATWYRFPAVTARIFVRYRKPVPINTELLLRAELVSVRGRSIRIRGELLADEPLAEARAAFLHVPFDHFLSTPEGRAARDLAPAASRRLRPYRRRADRRFLRDGSQTTPRAAGASAAHPRPRRGRDGRGRAPLVRPGLRSARCPWIGSSGRGCSRCSCSCSPGSAPPTR